MILITLQAFTCLLASRPELTPTRLPLNPADLLSKLVEFWEHLLAAVYLFIIITIAICCVILALF
jgi:hypothetical protein